MLDGTTITQTDGDPAWKGPGIDLFDLRIDLETHLVGQLHQAWVSDFVVGELLGTSIAFGEGHGHTVLDVHLRLHRTHWLVPPAGLQLYYAVIRYHDFLHILRLDMVG